MLRLGVSATGVLHGGTENRSAMTGNDRMEREEWNDGLSEVQTKAPSSGHTSFKLIFKIVPAFC